MSYIFALEILAGFLLIMGTLYPKIEKTSIVALLIGIVILGSLIGLTWRHSHPPLHFIEVPMGAGQLPVTKLVPDN